ncbi:HigA family addiction module antitoxin [Shumkonia mesophila]|uniref:HigA family addiction module antitoxin n=1 Tax=Shumkonia mesophila TaxID=2838854 RepID=UPI002934DDBA|nr:HigA family addiction module antitoxin [Shumkonia mesophila]
MSKSSTIIAENKLPPIHPGEHLRDEMEVLKLSGNQFAQALGVPTNRLTEIVAGRRGITADTALRLGRYFGNGGAIWMRLQVAYDLRVAEIEKGEEITRTVRPRAA